MTYHQPEDASKPEFVDIIKKYSPDLIFSFSYSKILKNSFLREFPDKVFNIHFSLLPKNRGCLPLIYALAEEERLTGVTLHLVDEGIDTGDIIAQKNLPISRNDTARTLYFRATAVGVALFSETYPAIVSGDYPRLKQTQKGMSYHPQENPNDRWIDWNWSEDKIHAFIRAHTFEPYPGARFIKDGKEIEVRMIDGRCQVGEQYIEFKDFLRAYR